RALARLHLRPIAVVRAAGRLHRLVDVALVGLGDLGELLLGARADGVEVRAAAGGAPATADEELLARLYLDVIGRLGGGGVVPRAPEIERRDGRVAGLRDVSAHDVLSVCPSGRRGPQSFEKSSEAW